MGNISLSGCPVQKLPSIPSQPASSQHSFPVDAFSLDLEQYVLLFLTTFISNIAIQHNKLGLPLSTHSPFDFKTDAFFHLSDIPCSLSKALRCSFSFCRSLFLDSRLALFFSRSSIIGWSSFLASITPAAYSVAICSL